MRYVLTGIGLFVLLLALAGTKALQISTLIRAGESAQQAGPPPEVVGAAVAELQQWEQTLTAVASVVSAQGVAVSNDAAGVVQRLHFQSGAMVRKGDALVTLDSRVERAQLKAALARRDLAEKSRRRSRALVAVGAVPQAQVDTDDSEFRTLGAEVRALEAEIARKQVRAPFDGRLGIREIDLGEYMAPGTTVAVLESTESIHVDFSLPQQHLDRIAVGMPVRASLAPDAEPLAVGAISTIEPAVDAATRTGRVRASLPPSEGKLRPGMFLRVAVVLPKAEPVVVVPQTAVIHAPYGDSVFCLDPTPGADTAARPGKVARQQFVRLGEARGDFVAVQEGIAAGEEVVVSGAFKLRNGMPVRVDNTVRLEPKTAPRIENR